MLAQWRGCVVRGQGCFSLGCAAVARQYYAANHLWRWILPWVSLTRAQLKRVGDGLGVLQLACGVVDVLKQRILAAWRLHNAAQVVVR